MSLATGARLGAYEITGRLGAGAMGEVFRARDARLGRDVAIKILPPALADSSERRRRFEQESRAAGALNHPNVVGVYDTGDQDGVAYIVSEFVDGESLRELIRRGPVPVRKAIDIAAQIADGLAAAHSANIVHRDLKPENVMLTRDGRVKILDFGLARYQPAPTPPGVHSTDGTMTMTNPGIIMGTPGYMSPEQVAGAPVDGRTDIFSLGIILYEMLAGKQAFERATSIETMNAILREDPPDLPAAVPPALKAIVLHCLEKEPQRRYQSPHDLAFALRALSGSAITSAPSLPALKLRRALSTPVILAAGVLALIAVYAVAGLLLAPRGVDLSTYRFTPLASGATPQGNPAWAPDGKSVAYIKANPGAADSLMIRSMESMLPVTVARGDFNGAPFWSPDGGRLFFVMTHQGVHSVSRAGGGHQAILKGDFAAAALSPDGRSLAAWLILDSHEGPVPKLWISSPPGAAPRQYEPVVWKEQGSAQPIYLRFSPNGRELAASITTANGAEIWLLPFPDGANARGKPRRAFSSSFQGFAPAISWMPDNRNLLISFSLGAYKMSQLWIGDTANGSVTPITSGESELRSAAVSPDGTKIAYQNMIGNSDIVQLPVDGSPINGGMLRPLLATARDESAAAWSPAAPQFAYVTSRNGRPEIWIESTQEGWERPVLTQHDFPDDSIGFFSLSFSPDGDRLAYMRMSAKRLATIWISPASGGEPIQLSGDDEFGIGPTWSPDGNSLAYTSSKGGLVKVAVGSGQAPVSIREKGCQYAAQWSPDGQWISCPDNGHINLVSADGKTSRMLGSRAAMATWSRDSKSLFTLGQDETQKWLFTSIDARSGAERTLATLGAENFFWASISNASMISMAPDGKSVAATKTSLQSEVWLLEGFPRPRGWLRRLLWWR